MPKYLKTSFILTVVLLLIVGLTSDTLAREDYFNPAIGEALVSSVGAEQAALSEDGGLSLVASDGKILTGWPLSVDNNFLTGSPLLVDMNGDGVSEVVTIGRDVNNIYTIFVYNGSKKLLASISLGVETIYYDPVALPLKNQTVRDILVPSQSGKILQVHLNGGVLTSAVLLNLSKPLAINVNKNGTELAIVYPGSKSVDIYSIDGTKITLLKKITLSSEIIFPLSYDAAESILYGVTKDNKIVAIEKSSANIVAGFPTSLSSLAVGSPVLVNIDGNVATTEIVINLSNGRKDVFSETGEKLPIDLGIKSFGDQSLDISNKVDDSLFSGLNNFVLRSVNSLKYIVASFWSDIKINIISKFDLLDATIAVTPSTGVPPLPVKLTSNPSGGSASNFVTKLNFNQLNLRNIVPAFASGTGESQDDGDTLHLNKLMWKAVNAPYTITPNTVVELDFKSNGLGWSHGFGFDNGYPGWNEKHYISLSSVYGDSPTTDSSFNDYNTVGQWKHYKVPVGQLLANNIYSEMYFNSYCDNASCPAIFDSYFRNVRIYESDNSLYTYAWDFGDGLAVSSSVGFDSIYHIYKNPGDYIAKVTVDDGKTQLVRTTSIKTAWATFDTALSATPPVGVPPLPVKLSATPSGGAVLVNPIKIDFNSQVLKNYSSYPNQSGTSTVLDGGDTLALTGFNFKTYDVDYQITSSTVVEFDYKSNVDGWSHGISFETPWTYGKRFFNLSGFADFDWTINDFKNYTKKGEWKHYKIPVGQYYAVWASRIVFNANCNNSSCPVDFDSYFRNVRIYESNKTNYTYAWDFGDGVTVTSSAGLDSIYHTYNSIGDFTAKVTVDDGQMQVVKTTPIKIAWSSLDTILTATPNTGIYPLATKLFANSSGGAASKVPVSLDFSKLTLRNIVPSLATGSGVSQDDGDTLYLNKQMWKAVSAPYTITPNTVVELDFKSNGLGWSHGFGFDNGYPEWNVKHYIAFSSVYGDTPIINNSFNDYNIVGQWKHYKVPVGQLLVNKTYSEIYFNSECGNASCPPVFDSYFRNVRMYESDKPNYMYTWDFGDGTTATSSAGLDSVYHNFTTSSNYVVSVSVSDGQNTINKTTTVSVTP